AAAASLNGLLVVMTKLLTDRGLGVAEIYVVRTSVAAAIWVALALPRDIPPRAVPHLFTRSSFQTGYFVLIILAVQRGSPAAVHSFDAPDSAALRVGQLVFVSGSVSVDADGNLVGAGDLAAQTRQTLANIGRLLEAAGCGWEHVAQLTYYLSDISQWGTVGSV